MTWFSILKGLEFKGGIVLTVPAVDLQHRFMFRAMKRATIDHSQTMFKEFHITLFSPQEVKSFKEVHGLSNKGAKLKIRELLESFTVPHPSLVLGILQYAERGEKTTFFFPLKSQSEWQIFSNKIADKLEIPHVERFFHISVSNNQGGNPYQSIGNITEDDVSGWLLDDLV